MFRWRRGRTVGERPEPEIAGDSHVEGWEFLPLGLGHVEHMHGLVAEQHLNVRIVRVPRFLEIAMGFLLAAGDRGENGDSLLVLLHPAAELPPLDDHYLVITFRTPRQWNRHWGGFLECKLRIQDQMNPRIPALRKPLEFPIVSQASEADLETIRCWYNEAAAMTTNPDDAPDYLTDLERKLSEDLRVPLQAPLSAEYDNEFLLRFRTGEDVRRLAMFILQRLPEWMESITAQWRSSYESSGRILKPNQPFLDAIQADPDSDVPRLAYADWLADRGDAWSEVIRIQCHYPDGYMPWKTADQLEPSLVRSI